MLGDVHQFTLVMIHRSSHWVMSETDLAAPPGLYVGGLRNDLHPLQLVRPLCRLFSKFQVSVAQKQVNIHFKANRAYAFVDMPNASSCHHLLSELSHLDNVQNVFDLSQITFYPGDFRIGPRLSNTYKRNRSRSRSQHRNRQQKSKPVECTSAASLYVISHHTSSVASRRSPQPGPSTQKQKKGGQSQSREEFPMRGNASGMNLQSESLTSHSDSDSESESDSASRLPSASNCTGSAVDSKEKVNSASQSLCVNKSYTLTARDVSRLRQQSNPDCVAKSHSDRGIPYAMLDRSTAATSTTGLPSVAQVSTTTSTADTGNQLVCRFYHQGQEVGRETRHKEFKQGGRACKDQRWLTETVGKYVCGFLNSKEGGTLFVGVNDQGAFAYTYTATGIALQDHLRRSNLPSTHLKMQMNDGLLGVVLGFKCPQSKEDQIRLTIDEALKGIEPSIFTDAYSVRFVPVMKENGQLSENCQVLEITVNEMSQLKYLHDFRGKAYLRRDGSLQGPLSARQVQEWTRKQLEQDTSGPQLITQLCEMTSELEKEREQNAKMRRKLTELEGRMSQVEIERKKSKICAIM